MDDLARIDRDEGFETLIAGVKMRQRMIVEYIRMTMPKKSEMIGIV